METKKIVKYTDEYFKKNYTIGLKIDKSDIKPPTIILIQKSSDTSKMTTPEGDTPKPGEYFHTGRLEIMKEFNCYFIFVAKSFYYDKRDAEQEQKPQFKAIGVMSDDFSVFGMTFKGTYLYTLSSLFTTVASQKKPMFVFKCRMETKQISGAKGDWYVPVLRIEGVEEDEKKLQILEEIAKAYDKAKPIIEEDKEEIEEEKKAEVEDIPLVEPSEDIPF